MFWGLGLFDDACHWHQCVRIQAQLEGLHVCVVAVLNSADRA